MNNVSTEPTAFIMLPSEVRALAHRGERDERISYWLQPPAYDIPEYREAWRRIGRGD